MKIALCNEVIREMAFPAQCEFAAALGYESLEVAPFTFGDEPHLMSDSERAAIRRAAEDAGIAVAGLHWLLVTPEGMTLNGPDAAARSRTVEVIRRLIGLCAELGGDYMVHGSPFQRSVAEDDDPEAAWRRAVETFQTVAPEAEAAEVTYCVEPLSPPETNFITSVEEAVALVDAIASPAFKTMIDTRAASRAEKLPVAELMDLWLPTGRIGHVQVNDRNRRGPGQGDDQFAPVFAALKRNGYDRTVGVEPFEYIPDGPATAAFSIGYIRGILEALDP